MEAKAQPCYVEATERPLPKSLPYAAHRQALLLLWTKQKHCNLAAGQDRYELKNWMLLTQVSVVFCLYLLSEKSKDSPFSKFISVLQALVFCPHVCLSV